MAVNSISSNIINQLQNAQQHQQRHQARKAMIQALIAGDLDATKAAFATLASLSPKYQNPESRINQFGVALQSATNITEARDAFIAWKPDMANKINGTESSHEQKHDQSHQRRLILTA